MTERIKDRMTGILVTIILGLLSLTAAGVGYLIVENSNRMTILERNDADMKRQIYFLTIIAKNDDDTDAMECGLIDDYLSITTRGAVK